MKYTDEEIIAYLKDVGFDITTAAAKRMEYMRKEIQYWKGDHNPPFEDWLRVIGGIEVFR